MGKGTAEIRTAYRDCTLKMATREANGQSYLFVKAPDGSYHAFAQVMVKNALRACNPTAKITTNTRQAAKSLLGF